MLPMLIIPIWLLCGFVNFGFDTAYFTKKYDYSNSPREKVEYIDSMIMSFLTGPISLIMGYFLYNHWRYGWTIRPWRDYKYQKVLDRLDQARTTRRV